MFDTSSNFKTLRYAKAEGFLYAAKEAICQVKTKSSSSINILEISRAAGITAAKRCSDLVILKHPVPLDWVEIKFEVENKHIQVIAEVRSVWKTGVEVEAMSAVSAVLLNIYDQLKSFDPAISFGDIRIVKQKGGKSSFSDSFTPPIRTAVLVMSDSTHAGTREDKSGKIIKDFLVDHSVDVAFYEVLPDDKQQITQRLISLADNEEVQLIITTGGTGLGPRDVTPEATMGAIERTVPGIVEAIRKYGKDRTPYAMLSRGEAGVRGKCLIINMPGSSKGALESMQAIFPGVLHIFPMMEGLGH